MNLQAMSKGACDVTMSSIELLELVNESRVNHGENPVRHNDFIARCKDELDEGDYEIFVIAPPERGGRSFEAIRMTADQCKLVAMRESKGVRRWVLNRLKELEAKQAPVVPQSLSQALRLAADQAELIERQGQQLAIAAPKVEFVDQFVRANGSKGFRAVCKLLNAKEPAFRLFLVEKKIMYRLGDEWMPYQQHIDAGRFEIKAGVAHVSEHAYNRALFTPKGVNWVAAEWAKHRVALVTAGKAVVA